MSDETVEIDAQSYYTMMVYDLEPDHVANFFGAACNMENDQLKDLTETALSYLDDRINDGSTSSDPEDMEPHPDKIREKIVILERLRSGYADGEVDTYLDYSF